MSLKKQFFLVLGIPYVIWFVILSLLTFYGINHFFSVDNLTTVSPSISSGQLSEEIPRAVVESHPVDAIEIKLKKQRMIFGSCMSHYFCYLW